MGWYVIRSDIWLLYAWKEPGWGVVALFGRHFRECYQCWPCGCALCEIFSVLLYRSNVATNDVSFMCSCWLLLTHAPLSVSLCNCTCCCNYNNTFAHSLRCLGFGHLFACSQNLKLFSKRIVFLRLLCNEEFSDCLCVFLVKFDEILRLLMLIFRKWLCF